MNSKEIILKLYDYWQECQNDSYMDGETLDTYFTEQQKRCVFLSDSILGITTDDDSLSLDFGKMILDTLIQIKNKTIFKYIEDKNNYKNYILSCNFIENWLEWGSSIRGAWFNTDGKIYPSESLCNIYCDQDYIEITEEFMDWFINFLQGK